MNKSDLKVLREGLLQIAAGSLFVLGGVFLIALTIRLAFRVFMLGWRAF